MQYMSIMGVSDNDVAKLLGVLNNEKDLFVIKEGIKALSNEMKKPEVSQFILSKVNLRKVSKLQLWIPDIIQQDLSG